MKKLLILAVMVFFAVGASYVYAETSSDSSAKSSEKSLFQMISDSWEGKWEPKEKNKIKPISFQSTYDGIEKTGCQPMSESKSKDASMK